MVTAPFVEPERRLARFGYFAECPNAIRFTRMNQLFQHSPRAGGFGFDNYTRRNQRFGHLASRRFDAT